MTRPADPPTPGAQPTGELSADDASIAAGSALIAPGLPASALEIGDPRDPAPLPRAERSRAAAVARAVALVALVLVVVWAYHGIAFDFSNLRDGLAVVGSDLAQLVPRNAAQRAEEVATFRSEWGALIQTLQMAIFGTVAGALVAFPVSFFAARTTTLFRPLSVAIKTVLNIGRAIPVIIYAILIVAAFGLGAPPGAIAIAFGAFVMLTKLYAEGLESIAPGPVEAVRATGGNAIQTYIFGMLPQVFPNYLSATLYAFELNIAASAILGIVGAGGLGFDLQNDIRLFKLLDAGAILFMLIVLVNVVDYVSYRVRQLFT